MTDATGTTERDYDELGRCIEKTVPTIGKSTYQYDITEGVATGAVAEKTIDPKGNVTIKEYDKAGRLAKVSANSKDTTYEYYDNGAAKSITRSSGVKTSFTYTKTDRLETLKTTKNDALVEEFSYKYDFNGNMTEKIDRKGTTSYNYDALNRLEKVTETGNKITSYTYDKAGNRLTQTANGKTTTYTYDNRNRLTATTDGTDTYKFEYDNNGNQLKQKKVAGSNETVLLENIYDEFNQAIETRADGKVIKNTYNGDGLRVVKDVNGTKTNYLYEGMQVVLETDSSNNETARNVHGNQLISRTAAGKTYDYAYNGMAEITGLIDENGNFANRYYYDAFGNQTERTGSVVNPYSYKSYQYDDETELYYLNSRYYDPETARFLTEDTVRGDVKDPLSLNLYTYCKNEPLMNYDPDGHASINNSEGEWVYDSNTGQTVYVPIGVANQMEINEEYSRQIQKHGKILKPIKNSFGQDQLKTGSMGKEVKILQGQLQSLGLYKGPIDGKFGPGTKAALIAYQIANGLKADGIYGPRSKKALENEYDKKLTVYDQQMKDRLRREKEQKELEAYINEQIKLAEANKDAVVRELTFYENNRKYLSFGVSMIPGVSLVNSIYKYKTGGDFFGSGVEPGEDVRDEILIDAACTVFFFAGGLKSLKGAKYADDVVEVGAKNIDSLKNPIISIYRKFGNLGNKPVSLKQLKIALGKKGMSIKNYELKHIKEILDPFGGKAFAEMTQIGDDVLRGKSGKPLIKITDKGLSSMKEAVKSVYHEINHIESFLRNGVVSAEEVAEDFGIKMLEKFMSK